jgi:hypothetical protein
VLIDGIAAGLVRCDIALTAWPQFLKIRDLGTLTGRGSTPTRS